MRDKGGGVIVNTASALSLVSDPFLPVYTASKHAMLGLTRSVGVAYAPTESAATASAPAICRRR